MLHFALCKCFQQKNDNNSTVSCNLYHSHIYFINMEATSFPLITIRFFHFDLVCILIKSALILHNSKERKRASDRTGEEALRRQRSFGRKTLSVVLMVTKNDHLLDIFYLVTMSFFFFHRCCSCNSCVYIFFFAFKLCALTVDKIEINGISHALPKTWSFSAMHCNMYVYRHSCHWLCV